MFSSKLLRNDVTSTKEKLLILKDQRPCNTNTPEPFTFTLNFNIYRWIQYLCIAMMVPHDFESIMMWNYTSILKLSLYSQGPFQTKTFGSSATEKKGIKRDQHLVILFLNTSEYMKKSNYFLCFQSSHGMPWEASKLVQHTDQCAQAPTTHRHAHTRIHADLQK